MTVDSCGNLNTPNKDKSSSQVKREFDKSVIERIERAFRMEKHHEERANRSHQSHVKVAEILRPYMKAKIQCKPGLFKKHDSETCPVCALYRIAETLAEKEVASHVIWG